MSKKFVTLHKVSFICRNSFNKIIQRNKGIERIIFWVIVFPDVKYGLNPEQLQQLFSHFIFTNWNFLRKQNLV